MYEKTAGWAGKILRVELNNGHLSTESTLRHVKRFIGGRGINWWILFNEIKRGSDPLGPDNLVAIGAGPLVGTLAPGACRCSLDFKSPLTQGVGSANIGGHWGSELKFAGYDNLIIGGKAKLPTYVFIDDDHVELRNADHLWGRTTWETSELIKEEVGDSNVQVLSIGPAGENLCMGACVITNNARAAGRCNVGAVFGSKNLKAIAVRGTGSVNVADPEEFLETVDKALRIITYDKSFSMLSTLGLAGILDSRPEVPRPVRNSQDAYWDESYWARMGGKALVEKYETRKLSCFACPINCSHWLEVRDGPFSGLKGEGFEANTGINWGSRIGVDYLPATIKLHVMCNQLGLDVDIPSVTIGWAMECYQRGILTEEDTDGLDLSWGNYDSVIELLQRIAHRAGKFANLLADGVKLASEKVGRGSEKYAFHVKGQELYEECRVGVAWALGIATSTRGGTHTRGAAITEYFEVTPERAERIYGVRSAGDKRAYEGKGKLVVYTEQLKGVIDSLGLCLYVSNWMSPTMLGENEFAELFGAATDVKLKGRDLLVVGERIQNLEKAFNVREAGFRRKDDSLPDRFFEPIPRGPAKGFCLNRSQWEKALDEYYQEHNWDVTTGLQTRDALKNLDLEEVADDLAKIGGLSNPSKR